QFETLASQGNSVSFLVIEGENSGIIAQGDQIKPGSRKMIEALFERDITPVMLTGDNRQVAESVASELGITDVHGQLMPEDKERIIREYQENGRKVMMVGDGINDAPSLRSEEHTSELQSRFDLVCRLLLEKKKKKEEEEL